ncbi:hypothetical protein BKA62DRAFT_682779 [Auriculariales sp. MPI-PUGE-AT-0066]|nr:hypothetical protein BKA62DRAFT_682779 [Auriculariales sp. MPI-PUGE-AT-0066]
MRSLILAFINAVVVASARTKRIKAVALFGDSFTDQSRSHAIGNGTWPGKDYQQVYPPADHAATGGFQWPYYLGIYGNYSIHNYAVGGSVCSNEITPVTTVPADISGGQKKWFVEDHVVNGKLQLDPEEFVTVIWGGTNDVGIHSFISNDQRDDVSIADVTDCQLNFIRSMHDIGARRFIVMSMIPLQLTRLYANTDEGTIYWPDMQGRNGSAWHKAAYNYPNTVNRFLKDGVERLNREFHGSGRVEYFNTYSLFEEFYNHPTKYYNGSIPANVTGHCHQCPNPFDWHFCDIGDCTLDQRDSFMWWDELHPSEQTGRNIAAEIKKKIDGKSKY